MFLPIQSPTKLSSRNNLCASNSAKRQSSLTHKKFATHITFLSIRFEFKHITQQQDGLKRIAWKATRRRKTRNTFSSSVTCQSPRRAAKERRKPSSWSENTDSFNATKAKSRNAPYALPLSACYVPPLPS